MEELLRVPRRPLREIVRRLPFAVQQALHHQGLQLSWLEHTEDEPVKPRPIPRRVCSMCELTLMDPHFIEGYRDPVYECFCRRLYRMDGTLLDIRYAYRDGQPMPKEVMDGTPLSDPDR